LRWRRIRGFDQYYYKYSKVYTDGVVNNENITEVNLNTSPPSFVINDNEVIFISYRLKDNLREFGERHKIPIVDRFDIWSALNDPFLDTEFDEAYKQKKYY
jgi:hypothetical protein